MATPVDIVRRFRRLTALVIGDAMLDSYLEGTAARLCTEGPVPVVRKTADERAPGGAANTAANLRALGADVIFLGTIGSDLSGALLRETLRERGVDDAWLIEDPDVSTLHKLRILADGQYVVRFDEGNTLTGSPGGQAALLSHLEQAFPRCDVVVISDYNYGVASDALLGRLRALRADRPVPLVVDSKNLRRFREVQATVITPNHLEAQLVIDPTSPGNGALSPSEIEVVGRRLVATLGVEHAAITRSGDGVCLVGRRGKPLHLAAHAIPNASDVGAGDSFTAALALALTAGAACPEAARIGIDAAGIAIAKRRTAVVYQQELLQRVSLRAHAYRGNRGRIAIEALAARLDAERIAGRRIVFTNGVFDLLHAGHIEFLRQAKALGDILVVGVNSDRSARQLKGKNRPITSEQDRLALVAALDPVDHAVLFDEETPAALIRALRPHVHAKGGDYVDEELPEAAAVHEVGGRVEILPLVGSLSTTSMIDRIATLAADGEIGAAR